MLSGFPAWKWSTNAYQYQGQHNVKPMNIHMSKKGWTNETMEMISTTLQLHNLPASAFFPGHEEPLEMQYGINSLCLLICTQTHICCGPENIYISLTQKNSLKPTHLTNITICCLNNPETLQQVPITKPMGTINDIVHWKSRSQLVVITFKEVTM